MFEMIEERESSEWSLGRRPKIKDLRDPRKLQLSCHKNILNSALGSHVTILFLPIFCQMKEPLLKGVRFSFPF